MQGRIKTWEDVVGVWVTWGVVAVRPAGTSPPSENTHTHTHLRTRTESLGGVRKGPNDRVVVETQRRGGRCSLHSTPELSRSVCLPLSAPMYVCVCVGVCVWASLAA